MQVGGEGVPVVVDAAVELRVGREDARLHHVAEGVDVKRTGRAVGLGTEKALSYIWNLRQHSN